MNDDVRPGERGCDAFGNQDVPDTDNIRRPSVLLPDGVAEVFRGDQRAVGGRRVVTPERGSRKFESCAVKGPGLGADGEHTNQPVLARLHHNGSARAYCGLKDSCSGIVSNATHHIEPTGRGADRDWLSRLKIRLG